MDFLLGNPFSSPVGQRIEKATDGSLQSEDWALNMEICDIINETEEGPKDALRAVKKRIVGNKNFHEVMLALTVLETCVKNCGHRFHVLVASQDFVESVLVRTILPKNNPPTIVHDKVLNLIQTVFNSETQSGQDSVGTDSSQQEDSGQHAAPLPAPPILSGDTPIAPTPEQIGKLRSELEMVSGNVRVMSEMLTELVPTQAEPADLELLQELNRTCRAMQQRVLELIPQIANEQLTEELLIVNDNLNNVFLRHERFERFRTGQTTKAPSEAEPAADLIDMGPDPAATGNLSSQLAGMNLGSSSVRAGLQSLEASGRLEDEFDMFALTRGSSLADQRKEVKYEAPQATDGLAGALDARQQSTGAIPVTQACLMEDIEQWLSTDVGNDAEEPKGVTSEEFDKFLEERAKAADRLPNLSSPSAEGPPGPPSGPAPRKKTQEKDDDMLFAL
ncbi:target of myb1 membrane trafficking protein [Homo sapiens]|uniref:Isoform 3 of Target of Myb1 membrane trafficking protein n=1 Tax=Homo sapiens TaxID=9606 RepID=O60784-3|nr:target of Myb1 membrane trafficking protein isoform 4 [Homo sapiens]KAI2597530.1 target of myb1 membrane trafficking protein [Homo sapiens]KAI4002717.1 target of myb1 membrane trafficking protein [Homo sapiens]|eukprot:NP_001129202.1 target of Myb protein 1 isoform 4 [Homo sapiens]